jgi:ectoine hydroxylase-related dioxygenase (phytanoyl-CoA dioxygenase family)
MNLNQALCDLGINNQTINNVHRKHLDIDGFVILHNVLKNESLNLVRSQIERLHEKEGRGAGIEVHQESGARRLSDLVNKGEVFDQIYTNPQVLACIHHVIGRDFKLSSLNSRDALPGQGLQGLHADWGKDYDGCFHVCNSIWLLDDFSHDNGCTRLVPGSHKKPLPGNALDDPMKKHPNEKYVIAPAGSVAVFNSHTWHGGTTNISANLTRRAIHCYYTARENQQQLNQREYLRYETFQRLSPAARYILDVDIN